MERFMLLEQTTATRRELSYRREDILNLLAFTFYPIMHKSWLFLIVYLFSFLVYHFIAGSEPGFIVDSPSASAV